MVTSPGAGHLPQKEPTLRLPRTVLALGLVSFLTDFSSEMIYPLLPLFLATVLSAGPRALGLIEGVAESTASLLKVFSGWWSDRARRRKPLVLAGYSLAGAARPLIGLAQIWPTVLFLRFVDRVGKGLRTSPRDALIADLTSPELRGRAYGVQRALDHAGAVLGPLAAAFLMTRAGLSLRDVFLLAAVPAALVVVVLLSSVREPPETRARPRAADVPAREPSWGRPFYVLLLAVFLFTLGNSSDAFLLLRLSHAGLSPPEVALLWSLFHVVKAGATYAGGRLSDRLGRRPMVIAGWSVYALIYIGFAALQEKPALVAIFLAYGIYFGLTEPVERAWIADLAPASRRATAFGYYHATVGAAALPASLLFGFLWEAFGSETAFGVGAALALSGVIVLTLGPRFTRAPIRDLHHGASNPARHDSCG
jgi:MFS family permease